MNCAICDEDLYIGGIVILGGDMVRESDTIVSIEFECLNCNSTVKVEADIDTQTAVWS